MIIIVLFNSIKMIVPTSSRKRNGITLEIILTRTPIESHIKIVVLNVLEMKNAMPSLGTQLTRDVSLNQVLAMVASGIRPLKVDSAEVRAIDIRNQKRILTLLFFLSKKVTKTEG